MAQTAEITLETLVGPLAKIFPQLERDTILHSDQLMTERRTNPELRNQWFYTADSSLYTVEKEGGIDEAFLYLGREPTNPIFNNIGEATQQLVKTRNYIPSSEDVGAVVKAESTLRVKLSGLGLQKSNDEVYYFEIQTDNYDKLNPEQRRVAKRVYGQGNDFIENMEMLNKAAIRKTRVYVLNPEYVKNNVPQDGAIARASGLYGFVLGSRFFADGRDVDFHLGLRGVRKILAYPPAKQVMIFLSTDKYVSPFDILLLADLFPQARSVYYGSVNPEDVQKLVQDSIFPRGPEGCKNTKLFIGGSDVEKANKIIEVALKSMFPPYELATIIDPSGAHTTSSAAVAKVLQILLKNNLGDYKDKNVTVLAATGPVGQITSSIFQSEGSNVTVTSRRKERALSLAEILNKTSSNKVVGLQASTYEEVVNAISKADVIMAAGSAGVQLLSLDTLENYGKQCKVVADVNAVPPVGVENLCPQGDGVELLPGLWGVGALAVGSLKNKVEAMIISKAMESPNGVFDYKTGYLLAKEHVYRKLGNL